MATAPKARPMPTPSAATFFFSSIDASSSTSRAIVLAFSATSFAAVPRLTSVSWVGMAPPVDEFRQHDAGDERGADNEQWVRPASAPLRPGAELGAAGSRRRALGRRQVGGRLALGARDDQARLQPSEEGGVVGELVADLGGDSSLCGGAVGDLAK